MSIVHRITACQTVDQLIDIHVQYSNTSAYSLKIEKDKIHQTWAHYYKIA
jgi:hypothetical protein